MCERVMAHHVLCNDITVNKSSRSHESRAVKLGELYYWPLTLLTMRKYEDNSSARAIKLISPPHRPIKLVYHPNIGQ